MKRFIITALLIAATGYAMAETDYIALKEIKKLRDGDVSLTNPGVSGSLAVDTITEYTDAAGVEIDGIKASNTTVMADSVQERTANAGVLVDGVKMSNTIVMADSVQERTANAGVLVDGVKMSNTIVRANSVLYGSGGDYLELGETSIYITNHAVIGASGGFIAGPTGPFQGNRLIEYSSGAGVIVDELHITNSALRATAANTPVTMLSPLVIQAVAAPSATNQGMIYFDTDDLHLYVWTNITAASGSWMRLDN